VYRAPPDGAREVDQLGKAELHEEQGSHGAQGSAQLGPVTSEMPEIHGRRFPPRIVSNDRWIARGAGRVSRMFFLLGFLFRGVSRILGEHLA
jgi:hypothetical protein